MDAGCLFLGVRVPCFHAPLPARRRGAQRRATCFPQEAMETWRCQWPFVDLDTRGGGRVGRDTPEKVGDPHDRAPFQGLGTKAGAREWRLSHIQPLGSVNFSTARGHRASASCCFSHMPTARGDLAVLPAELLKEVFQEVAIVYDRPRRDVATQPSAKLGPALATLISHQTSVARHDA